MGESVVGDAIGGAGWSSRPLAWGSEMGIMRAANAILVAGAFVLAAGMLRPEPAEKPFFENPRDLRGRRRPLRAQRLPHGGGVPRRPPVPHLVGVGWRQAPDRGRVLDGRRKELGHSRGSARHSRLRRP